MIMCDDFECKHDHCGICSYDDDECEPGECTCWYDCAECKSGSICYPEEENLPGQMRLEDIPGVIP